MRKVLIGLGLVAALAGCGVNNSSNIDFDANKIRYFMDTRTGLCYAVTASRTTGSLDTSGLGVAHVPCSEDVMHLLD